MKNVARFLFELFQGGLVPVAVMALSLSCSSGDSGSPVPDTLGVDSTTDELGSDSTTNELETFETTTDGTTQDVVVELTRSLVPGPGMDGYDADLDEVALLFERQFHVFTGYGNGLNSDVSVTLDNEENRALITSFLTETDGWDFEAYSGKTAQEVITMWHKVAGLYGGAGIAADAYRYAVLRDYGFPAEEVNRAREFLLLDMERMHMAQAITGVEGVIARGFIRLDIPNSEVNTVPVDLFDESGNPLPVEKTNGTWRADNSGGLYPNFMWEDSCSRDMYIGWMAAFQAVWEVTKDDLTIPGELKDRMKEDALALGKALMVVRESGYDLELPDADGRTTYHGYMNENNMDRLYLPGIRNGFYAIMALGSVGTLVYVTQDPELKSYLWDELIGERDLVGICRDSMMLVDMGNKTNYSNVNMAYQGAWLAVRTITDSPAVHEKLKMVIRDQLYDNGGERQPSDLGQSLFDFMTAAALADATAVHPLSGVVDPEIMGRGIQTLKEFDSPPFWDHQVENCDEAEIEALFCEATDGSDMPILGYEGRNDDLIAVNPLPMRLRPPSNYYWRSNPYGPNGGGDGTNMLPGVDFRYAYWLGRFVR